MSGTWSGARGAADLHAVEAAGERVPLAAWAASAIAITLLDVAAGPHVHLVTLLLVPIAAAAARGGVYWALPLAIGMPILRALLGMMNGNETPWTTEVFTAVQDALILSMLAWAVHRMVEAGRELETANRLKDRFLAVASHDLLNPIATIVTTTELLEEPGADLEPGERNRWLQVIRKNANFTTDLLRDLLDATQLEEGKMHLNPAPTQLSALVDAALEGHRLAARVKDLTLTGDVPTDLPSIQADPVKLQRLLNNLISNAVKFSDPGKQVTVRARAVDGGVQVDVEDTGQGIPEAEQGRLFQMFGVTSTRATRGEKSTGLGLMIARKIVDLHGGRIWVKSAPGSGSTFSVILPAAARR